MLLWLAASTSSAYAGFGAVGEFATSGSALGQVSAPSGAAVLDGGGYVLAADAGNARLQLFESSGGVTSPVGAIGIGSLDTVFGIATDQRAGAVYVSDPGRGRIVKFLQDAVDPERFVEDLSFNGPTGGTGVGEIGDFRSSVAVDPLTGDLLVADAASRSLKRFDSSGRFVRAFTGADRLIGPLGFLLSVAVGDDGDILVVDASGTLGDVVNGTVASRVSRFSADGTFLSSFGEDLRGVTAVAVAPGSGKAVVAGNAMSYWNAEAPSITTFDNSDRPVSTTRLPGATLYGVTSGIAIAPTSPMRAYATTDVDPIADDGFDYGAALGLVLEDIDLPVISVNPPVEVTAESARFSGMVDPSESATTWAFEYSVDGDSWQRIPEPGEVVGAAAGVTNVEADVEGLIADTAYRVRLVARNGGGEAVSGELTFITEPAPPAVALRPVVERTPSSATLRGRINPRNAATTYYFQYGTDGYQSRIPSGTSAVLDGTRDRSVSEAVRRLQPDTVYVYRLVASNATGTTVSSDGSFKTMAESSGTNRGYEQVTPVDKLGYAAGGNLEPMVDLSVAADGDAVTYQSFYPMSKEARSGAWGGWLSGRQPGGWTTASQLPKPSGPPLVYNGLTGTSDASLRGSTPDQSTSVYFDTTTALGGSLWIVRADGTRTRIADGTDNGDGTDFVGSGPGQPWTQGISDNGRHVVFASNAALVRGAPSGGEDVLYEWVDDGTSTGALRVVNRTNDSELRLIDQGSAQLGGAASDRVYRGNGDLGVRNAISADGRRIVFQTPAPILPGDVGGPVYVREAGETTVEVSAPEAGHTSASMFRYLDAARDGSVVYFWADGQLTDHAPSAGGIYRYSFDGADLSFVGQMAYQPSFPLSAVASADGTHLYYSDGGLKVNDGGVSRLVLGGGEIISATGDELNGAIVGRGIMREDLCPSINVSENGRFAAFNIQIAEDGDFQGAQIYRYDDATGELARVSARDGDSDTRANAIFTKTCNQVGAYPRAQRISVMSDDGAYVFFDTAAALIPSDNNGTWDAYSWNEGRLSLLGSGTAARGSSFIGTDRTGKNAFLTTAEALVPGDIDSVADIYDSRIDGGFGVREPVPPCGGEACQGPDAPAPHRSVPGSVEFRGPSSDDPVATAPRARLRLAAMSHSAIDRFRTTGKLTASLNSTVAGTVTGRLTARIAGKLVTVDARRSRVRPGDNRVTLVLSRRARKWARVKGLRVKAEWTLSTGGRASRTIVLASDRKVRRA